MLLQTRAVVTTKTYQQIQAIKTTINQPPQIPEGQPPAPTTVQEALTSALLQINGLRSDLHETRKLVIDTHHPSNELQNTTSTLAAQQLTMAQNLNALVDSMRISSESTRLNTAAITRTAETVNSMLNRADNIISHPDGTMTITTGPPPRDPRFRRWNSNNQSEWLMDVEERAYLARLAPQDRLAYAKLSLSHLSGHFMALSEVGDNWEEFKK